MFLLGLLLVLKN